MGKFKYQLIQAEGVSPDNTSNCENVLKVILTSAILILTFCYNWPVTLTITNVPSSMSPNLNDSFCDQRLTSTYYLDDIASTDSTQRQTIANSLDDITTATSTKSQTVNNSLDNLTSSTLTSTSTPRTILDSDLKNYFVYTPQCQMPAVNPFTKDVLKIFKKTAYKSCDSSKDIISVVYNPKERHYSLHMNEANFSCCYKTILRSGVGGQADNQFKLLPCSNFHQDFVVPQHVEAILTECRPFNGNKIVQQDAFGFVQSKKQDFTQSLVDDGSMERRPSVLLWGIDSMSRMNFERTMPKMYKYLRDENWYELQGYNKMADNTFPNLMAILTGYNNSRAMSVCKPRVVGYLDSCPMLWKVFRGRGYFTAYSEDWSKCATFNFNKKGFVKPPTDYYGRPLMLAVAKELKNKNDMGIPYCVGRRHYADYVYDAALQFTEVYKNQSTFGMFWTNSFSHNNFALPSSMDARVLEYMRSLNKSGTLEESIIVFFSDHGMRFGKLRKLDSGHLEERMPIMYIWLPKWFRSKYPEFANSLKLNRNRLTSPYDIYATLRHILELETPRSDLPLPESCPTCHSVFFKVDDSRGCREAGIDDHWCTCNSFLNVSLSDEKIKAAAEQLIMATNNFLAASNLTELCQPLKLSKIQSVQRKINLDTKGSESYLIKYAVTPKNALFEASTTWNTKSHRISIDVPDISRLDHYSDLSKCVSDNIAKKYCICYS